MGATLQRSDVGAWSAPTGRADGSQVALHPVGMGGTKVRTRLDREVVPRFFLLVSLQVKVRAPPVGHAVLGREWARIR